MDLVLAQKIVSKNFLKIQKEKKEKLSNWISDQIGKCLVYRDNNYGYSSNLKWDSFYRIIKKISEKEVLTEEWELIDSRKKIFKIERKIMYVHDWNLDGRKGFNGYDFCTQKEFEKNKKKILDIIGEK